jgi:hypothetical protein
MKKDLKIASEKKCLKIIPVQEIITYLILSIGIKKHLMFFLNQNKLLLLLYYKKYFNYKK